MKKCIIIMLMLFSFCLSLYAQEALPNGYRDIRLGMNIEEVKEALKSDSLFGYRGERDVSFLPSENQTLIETSSDSWLEHCWFQFYDDTLYTIIINFNPEKIDYHSVYNELIKQYGEHKELSPQRVVWENDSITLSLERPVSVKYIDRAVFDSLQQETVSNESITEMLRENILGDL